MWIEGRDPKLIVETSNTTGPTAWLWPIILLIIVTILHTL